MALELDSNACWCDSGGDHYYLLILLVDVDVVVA